jgi:hypothetical protein
VRQADGSDSLFYVRYLYTGAFSIYLSLVQFRGGGGEMDEEEEAGGKETEREWRGKAK